MLQNIYSLYLISIIKLYSIDNIFFYPKIPYFFINTTSLNNCVCLSKSIPFLMAPHNSSWVAKKIYFSESRVEWQIWSLNRKICLSNSEALILYWRFKLLVFSNYKGQSQNWDKKYHTAKFKYKNNERNIEV